MTNTQQNGAIQMLDVVALVEDVPEHGLWQGEIGAVVECHPDGAYEVEFVAQDGYTYALVTLESNQIIPLRQKRAHSDSVLEPAVI